MIDKHTGKILKGWEATLASIREIITTPKGTRVSNREFGCDAYLFLDSPISKKNDISHSIIDALERFENNFKTTRVDVSTLEARKGKVKVTIWGRERRTGQPRQAEVFFS